MTIKPVGFNLPQNNYNHSIKQTVQNPDSKNIVSVEASGNESKKYNREKVLAGIGSVSGVGLVLGIMMTMQKIKNPMKLNYKVQHMIAMAGCADIGGIMLSSVGASSNDKRKKWTEGAFQFALTSTPLIFVDTILKQCEKSSKKYINNNLTKIGASVAGVYAGSNLALFIANKIRKQNSTKQPERKLKLIDMIANFDDAVAIMVLAKIPFADKIQIKRLLPFIYSFCGFRSGTGNTRN